MFADTEAALPLPNGYSDAGYYGASIDITGIEQDASENGKKKPKKSSTKWRKSRDPVTSSA